MALNACASQSSTTFRLGSVRGKCTQVSLCTVRVLTPSSSFSMPDGKTGTPRLMAMHSPKSGTSSAL